MSENIADRLTDEALGQDNISVGGDISDEAENQEGLFDNTTNPKNHSELLEFKRFKIEQKNEKSERKLREKNAKKAFKFSAYWGIFIAGLILLHGFGKCFNFFELTQTEFLFVIGSLTTSIFAFYTLVLKYLFYRKPVTEKTNSNTET